MAVSNTNLPGLNLFGSNMQKEQYGLLKFSQFIGIMTTNSDSMMAVGLTVGSHVVSQQSFCGETFRAVRTLEPLTYSTHSHKARITR